MSEDQFIANTEIVIDDNIFFNERSIYWGLKFWGNEEFDIIKTSEFTYVQNNQACDWLSLREGEDVDST
jgi:acid phosphatase class B